MLAHRSIYSSTRRVITGLLLASLLAVGAVGVQSAAAPAPAAAMARCSFWEWYWAALETTGSPIVAIWGSEQNFKRFVRCP